MRKIRADLVDIQTDNGFQPLIPTQTPFFFPSFDRPSFNYSELFKTNPIKLRPGQRFLIRNETRSDTNNTDYKVQYYDTYLWIYFDWPGDNWREWESNYTWFRNDSYRESMKRKQTIYATIWKEGSEIVIQYWFFYPFDDWGNNHEGDWEHINVVFNTQLKDNAVIEKVQFHFHEKWKQWTPDALEFIDDTHVMVYVGGTFKEPWSDYQLNGHEGHCSGASYPKPVRWIDVGGWWSDDFVSGSGPLLFWYDITKYDETVNYVKKWNDINAVREFDGKGIEILKDPEYLGYYFFETHKEMSWLKANICFGEPSKEPPFGHIKVFLGPYHKPSWRTLGSNAEYSQY